MATIPSAYGTLGRMLPTVQPVVAPDLNAGMAIPSALAHFGDALTTAGFNAIERDQRRQDVQNQIGLKNLDTEFRSKMVAVNQQYDQAVKDISKRTDLTPEEQKTYLDEAGNMRKNELFASAPPAMQHYAPSFEQQMVQGQAELAKAQDAAMQADALIENIDVATGISAEADAALKTFDPSNPASSAEILSKYKQDMENKIQDVLVTRTNQLGAARAKATMEPIITASRKSIILLQQGMTKASQDRVYSNIELGVNAIRNSAQPVGDILSQITTIVNEGWNATGKTKDERVKYIEKQYQDVSKETIDKDFSISLPDGKHDAQGIAKLEAFVARWDSKTENGKEYAALPGMDKLTRQSYVKQAQEKIKAERDRIAKESKDKMSQDFQLAKDQIQDAMANGEMPAPELFAMLARTAQTKMQGRYVQELTTKANSAPFQIKAMAENPFRYTVSTMPGLTSKQRASLLQPLNASNMATLLPERMKIATQYNVPPITSDDATAFAQMASKRGARSAIDAVSAITAALPAEMRAMTTGYIASTVGRQNQQLGNALATAAIDPQLAGMYINGAELLKDKVSDKDTQKNISIYRDDIVKKYAGTGLSNYAQDYYRIMDIYTTALAGLQIRTGEKPDSYISDAILKKLVGEVETTSTGRFTGSKTKTIIPNGLDKDKVLNFSRNDQPDLAQQYKVDVATLRAPLTWTPGGYKLLRDGKYVKDTRNVDIVIPFKRFK